MVMDSRLFISLILFETCSFSLYPCTHGYNINQISDLNDYLSSLLNKQINKINMQVFSSLRSPGVTI